MFVIGRAHAICVHVSGSPRKNHKHHLTFIDYHHAALQSDIVSGCPCARQITENIHISRHIRRTKMFLNFGRIVLKS